jgi:hypothetical protein
LSTDGKRFEDADDVFEETESKDEVNSMMRGTLNG